MRVLHILHSLDPRVGGPTEVANQLVDGLDSKGVSSTLACLDQPSSPWLKSSSRRIIAFGPTLTGYGYRRHLPRLLHKLALEHDAVIVHGLWQYHGLATWRALRNTAIPYVIYPHGMLDPWFHRTNRLKEFKKWLYWPWAEYQILRDAKAVIFTAAREQVLARQSFWLYKTNAELVISLGISRPNGSHERQKILFLARFPNLQGKHVILYLGRIHPKKGLDLLIHSFARVLRGNDSYHLVIAGPDQIGWKVELKELARNLGIADQLTWTGMLDGDLKWGAYHAADVFCLPSHQENFGIVVAEALATGLPVLLSDAVNIAHEVENGRAGIIHEDTIEGTVSALTLWIDLDMHEKLNMRNNAKKLFYNSFEISKSLDFLINHLAN